MNITIIKATVHERDTTLEMTAEISELEDPIEAGQTLILIAKCAAVEPELGLAGIDLAAAQSASLQQHPNQALYQIES